VGAASPPKREPIVTLQIPTYKGEEEREEKVAGMHRWVLRGPGVEAAGYESK